MKASSLWSVAAFECRYQLKSPAFSVGSAIFFLLTFGSVTVDQIQIGGRGNVNINSPYAILQTLGIMSVFAMFVVTALVANAIVRDEETGFAPIVRTTPLDKGSYLVGRFAGAIAAALLFLASIPSAIAVGAAMPWIDAEKVGPFQPTHLLWALFCFGLPTLLITASFFFTLATLTRSVMWTYVGAVAFLVLYIVATSLLRDPQYDSFVALIDPFGLSALSLATKYWTASERNTQLPTLTGFLLANRLLWSALSVLLFGLAYRLFRPEQRGTHASASPSSKDPTPSLSPQPAPRNDRAARRAQFWRLALFDLAFVFRSPAFFVLLALGVLNSLGQLTSVGERYGSASYPVTRLMVQGLQGAFTLIPIIIAIYYGGELVWRDRERRTHEIIDATAAPDWAHLFPKILAIALVLASTTLVGVLTAIGLQLARGYHHLELGAYALWFALPTTITALLLAVLSVFVQVLAPQKFFGWSAMMLYLVASIALGNAGFEHKLYDYAGTPPVPLSDLSGAARFWKGAAWFQLYWSVFASLLMVASYALWRRGTEASLRQRLRQVRRRVQGPTLAALIAGVFTWIGLGAYLFHNTNRLNRYQTKTEGEQALAQMERDLLSLESVPQPRVAGVKLAVQLFPREARAVTEGSYRLVNRSSAPMDTLHIRWNEALRLDTLSLESASLERDYPQHHYRIYRLTPALSPGEQRTLTFTTTLEERGFPNGKPLTRIVENGTFLENREISPRIGMSREGLLVDRSKRRKHGLALDLRPPAREDEAGRAHNMLVNDSDWVDAELTITTDEDQTPIAPGTTVSDTTQGGRRTVRFRTDAPINHFFSIQSARYATRRDRLGEVDLAVYYHPEHGYNVDRMLATMKTSLARFSRDFSPYQFKQARVIEFPAYADYAQAFAGTIPYSENVGFLARHTDPTRVDMVTYITAHEVGHQWWGHQLIPSAQQGATMLVESFAQYSALLVMEEIYGRDHVRRFLKYELDKYLRARGGEVVEEFPLAQVENQPYIHYQKGTLVMYWLREVLGESVVNRALSLMLTRYAFKPAPYPNTLDFLRILRAEAGPEHDALIIDLFEKITLYDVKTTAVTATPHPAGGYEVRINVEARKLYADGKGKETEALLDEPFEVGVFSEHPDKAVFSAKSVLFFEKKRLHSGQQTLTFRVDQEPKFAGVDPYNKRIDRNSDDNLLQVARP